MFNFKTLFIVLPALFAVLGNNLALARNAAIMIDAESGNVIYETEATRPWYPASLTKVMTLYMAFDAVSSGRIGMQDPMFTSYHASRQPQSKLGLRPGETLTVEEAILAIVTRSANDAAVVLAEHLGGSEEGFASRMTTKARQIGMHNSRFMNATGLPNDLQVTTARDLALLAWRSMHDFPSFYPYFSSPGFVFKGRELKGINKFTAGYPGAEGMKTGYTCGSGFNLMSSAMQNGRRLIGVVLGGTTSAERYHLMTEMMDAGFANRYSNGYRNIRAMTASMGGEPPYLLPCGKRHADAIVQPVAVAKHYHKPVIGYHRPQSGRVRSAKPVQIASKGRTVKTTRTTNRSRAGYHRLAETKKPTGKKIVASKKIAKPAKTTKVAKVKSIKQAVARKSTTKIVKKKNKNQLASR